MKDFALLLFNVILSVLGQILLKQGMNQVGEISGSFQQMAPKLIQALMNPFVIGGIGVYGSTTLIWLVVLSRIKLSVAYPMISLGYIFSILFSWLLFKEDVPKIRVLGAFVICIGVYLVSMGEFGD
ncbi:MAG: EamA family transporter [Candidatus Poribacteria bacterium]|jgi:drug/metabolite transporter (DMT)-like permease|nr:EamA family transporter [Candidatus Poribacteria bacterium]MDP6746921.1 EamA family transporter [Candidatus Poribacteria bacterium]MDP6994818.1 EamA family transporter [Candidatus Poribacteria bacterium]MDP7279133.1 EamA family transporter [Candidatus Poribacteria bacterium]